MRSDIAARVRLRRRPHSPPLRLLRPTKNRCRETERFPSLRRTRKLRCRRSRQEATAQHRPQAMEIRTQRQISRARRLSGQVRLRVRRRPRHLLPHQLLRQRRCGRHFLQLATDRRADHRPQRLRLPLRRPLLPQYAQRFLEPRVNSWCRLPRFRAEMTPACW